MLGDGGLWIPGEEAGQAAAGGGKPGRDPSARQKHSAPICGDSGW